MWVPRGRVACAPATGPRSRPRGACRARRPVRHGIMVSGLSPATSWQARDSALGARVCACVRVCVWGVKNSFAQDLKDVVRSHGRPCYVSVNNRGDGCAPPPALGARGSVTGLVCRVAEFDTADEASHALRGMQGMTIGGQRISVRLVRMHPSPRAPPPPPPPVRTRAHAVAHELSHAAAPAERRLWWSRPVPVAPPARPIAVALARAPPVTLPQWPAGVAARALSPAPEPPAPEPPAELAGPLAGAEVPRALAPAARALAAAPGAVALAVRRPWRRRRRRRAVLRDVRRADAREHRGAAVLAAPRRHGRPLGANDARPRRVQHGRCAHAPVRACALACV